MLLCLTRDLLYRYLEKNYLKKSRVNNGYKLSHSESYKLINGEKLIIKQKVNLCISYKDKSHKVSFGILQGKNDNKVLLGNEDVKILKNENKKKLNIECRINTKGNGLISWYRPIKNQQDKIEFLRIVDEIEKRAL